MGMRGDEEHGVDLAAIAESVANRLHAGSVRRSAEVEADDRESGLADFEDHGPGMQRIADARARQIMAGAKDAGRAADEIEVWQIAALDCNEDRNAARSKAGAMLAFTLSLDDFVVSFFTSGPGSTTLPILIYSSVKRGITPDINALSTLIVLASILGAIFVTLLQRKNFSHR